MNRTLVDKTRYLLINSKLPRSFSAEAVSTTCYLINRSPFAAIGFKTFKELWFGKPASYGHLRIFGCPTYVHIKQGKLDAMIVKGLFVGYPDRIKGYKIWCGKVYMCLIRRDVQFNKAAMINKSDHATSKTNISVNKTNNTETIDQITKSEVLLSSIHEEDM